MKKILVLSDTHGSKELLRRILMDESDADALIFLGDGEDDLSVVESMCPRMPVYAVRGNCDFSSNLPIDGLLPIEGVLFYYTHGHIHDVKYGLDNMEEAVRSRGADVGLFGHTHHPILKKCGDVTLFNPGSAGHAYSGNESYGVITLSGGGTVEFEHHLAPAR